MIKKVEIPLDEVKRVFKFLENVHNCMHQPLFYQNSEFVEKFVKENYIEAKELYYHVIWNWLPKEIQNEIEES
ncbi:hypothetical protein [Leptospira noguchii]|uniref:Uncharacterized protein n=4 Tax=Leptospira noguchii TaxID=28182 RepID=M6YEU8_9LEPT|nr:hypothetical protein [Leptospira noguchii]EMO28457.1 hypothetical protein LEP1GSC170_0669 [Leptospira interrogans serovar Bataviae str. HAI135]EKR74518.1 hypothetical protein LEP1GSC041_1461 [Leptospira noguchii str. 2006001870]EMN02130.1 hypothetical protein LEP1GSC035_2749 [Leptospira noguchii str. 2007001578]EMO42454.1 hypothetical protein LEP1GSC186_1656 [Leptospira noguchii serovar Autumnalis str. ZUN142]EMO90371.1 hypothetical protein LEP1GSC024_4540 [Leptospira noguchii str. 20010340